jgi:hypothetical protein
VLSVWLLVSMGTYIYAQRVGVNVDDPTVIPVGNEYLRRAALALKSHDVNVKLDALLSAQLAGFTNVRDYLASDYRQIVRALIGIAVCVIVLLGFKQMIKLYPKSLFLFGGETRKLEHLQNQRQIWGICIVLAFIANVLAGLVVAVLTK